VQLAACSTPQGRVFALLRLWRTDDGVSALLPRELAPGVAAQLRRFVLRSKVTIADLSTEVGVIALLDDENAPPVTHPEVTRLMEGPGRSLLVVPATAVESVLAACATGRALAPATDYWAARIAAGDGEVFAATRDTWVAQMLNLDLLAGISFTKGCYTGQEIIARTQHLGRIKRRMFRYRASALPPPAPGEAVLQGEVKVGEVVLAARGPDGDVGCLAVVGLDARDRPLRLAGGATLTPLAVPYGIP
jgi:folate-binding protein YgfZ